MKIKLKSSTMRRLVSIGLVVVLMLAFALLSDSFLSARNIFLLLKDAGYLGLIACGLSIVMLGGGIDLSVGGICCVTGIICARLSLMGINGFVVLFLGIIIGALFGCVNGFVVAKIGLTEFVATLASGFVFTGLGLVLCFRDSGQILVGNLISKAITSPSYLSLGRSLTEGNSFYPITLAWILFTVVTAFVLYKTKFGLYTFAIGSNDKASAMSGVNTKLVKFLGFVICGGCAGAAAVFQTANMQTANALLGNGYEFQAIAACVVGGVVLGGGKGDTISAFIGALFMVSVLNGLMKLGLPTYWSIFSQGAIIVLATAFDAQFAKFAYRRRMTEQRLSAVS